MFQQLLIFNYNRTTKIVFEEIVFLQMNIQYPILFKYSNLIHPFDYLTRLKCTLDTYIAKQFL